MVSAAGAIKAKPFGRCAALTAPTAATVTKKGGAGKEILLDFLQSAAGIG
jgi:hypothetical protein